jgi:hypothetical protein
MQDGHTKTIPAGIELKVKLATVDLRRWGQLKDSLEANALLPNVAGVVSRFGRLANRADGLHIALGESNLQGIK